MDFKRIDPDPRLSGIIECYWIAEDYGGISTCQKIIPDGFPEIIFHYGDPYQVKLLTDWQMQSKALFAGQIKRHFFLQNTGMVHVLGIKLKPATPAQLFGIRMHAFTDKVVDLGSIRVAALEELAQQLPNILDPVEAIGWINSCFIKFSDQAPILKTPVNAALELIFQHHGMIRVSQICEQVVIGERQLEYLFKNYVGLSPKLYARIIRFNYIFDVIKEQGQSWCGMAYEASYFDQSHFIRNFREFTGENPSDYDFDERNMANFFLRK